MATKDTTDKIEQEINAAKNAYLYKDLLQGDTDRKLEIDECGEYLAKLEEKGRKNLKKKFGERIIGQDKMVHRLTLALVLNEHVLLEGLPGVGKTFMIKWIGEVTGLPFQRVQFIPDMLPSDLIGKDYIDPALLNQGNVEAVQWVNGPLFSCIVLADEINRAPSKVQAALLEAMGEGEITPFGKETKMVRSAIHEAAIRVWWEKKSKKQRLFGLPVINPAEYNLSQFNVFATMNPIEQEGTYPLSEAQIDRFCFKINVPYPERDYYEGITEAAFEAEKPEIPKVIYGRATYDDYLRYFNKNPDDTKPVLAPVYFFLRCRDHIFGYISKRNDTLWNRLNNSEKQKREKIFNIVYLSSLMNPSPEVVISKDEEEKQHYIKKYIESKDRRVKALTGKGIFQYVKTGSSPRGFLKLTKAVLGEALMNGGNFSDKAIRDNAKDVLKHRIRLEVHARLEKKTPEDVVDELCNAILD